MTCILLLGIPNSQWFPSASGGWKSRRIPPSLAKSLLSHGEIPPIFWADELALFFKVAWGWLMWNPPCLDKFEVLNFCYIRILRWNPPLSGDPPKKIWSFLQVLQIDVNHNDIYYDSMIMIMSEKSQFWIITSMIHNTPPHKCGKVWNQDGRWCVPQIFQRFFRPRHWLPGRVTRCATLHPVRAWDDLTTEAQKSTPPTPHLPCWKDDTNWYPLVN